jgi:hypothetical protein
MTEYNYKSFPLDGDMQDFVSFPDGPRVGTKAPAGALVDAKDGSDVQLADIYAKGITVIEFGSYT